MVRIGKSSMLWLSDKGLFCGILGFGMIFNVWANIWATPPAVLSRKIFLFFQKTAGVRHGTCRASPVPTLRRLSRRRRGARTSSDAAFRKKGFTHSLRKRRALPCLHALRTRAVINKADSKRSLRRAFAVARMMPNLLFYTDRCGRERRYQHRYRIFNSCHSFFYQPFGFPSRAVLIRQTIPDSSPDTRKISKTIHHQKHFSP